MISKELKRLSRGELVDNIYQLKKNEQEKLIQNSFTITVPRVESQLIWQSRCLLILNILSVKISCKQDFDLK